MLSGADAFAEELKATQKRLTNGSPSAAQCVLLGCGSRGSWMHRNRRANDAGWRRGRWPLQSCNIWDARRCCSGALLRTRLSQRRQRGLCCREPAGADGPRAARGDTCGLMGFDDGGRLRHHSYWKSLRPNLGPSSASVAATAPSAGKRAQRGQA